MEKAYNAEKLALLAFLIPRSSDFYWRGREDGATQSMTLAKARNLVKLDKNTKNGKIAVSMAKIPPPDLNFYQNKKQR